MSPARSRRRPPLAPVRRVRERRPSPPERDPRKHGPAYADCVLYRVANVFHEGGLTCDSFPFASFGPGPLTSGVRLDRQRELVLTNNGKPIAIVSATDEESFERSLAEIRQARALRAVNQMQQHAVATGSDSTWRSKRCITTAPDAGHGSRRCWMMRGCVGSKASCDHTWRPWPAWREWRDIRSARCSRQAQFPHRRQGQIQMLLVIGQWCETVFEVEPSGAIVDGDDLYSMDADLVGCAHDSRQRINQ